MATDITLSLTLDDHTLDVLVEPHGAVLVYDEEAGCYVRDHGLSPEQCEEARARAGLRDPPRRPSPPGNRPPSNPPGLEYPQVIERSTKTGEDPMIVNPQELLAAMSTATEPRRIRYHVLGHRDRAVTRHTTLAAATRAAVELDALGYPASVRCAETGALVWRPGNQDSCR